MYLLLLLYGEYFEISNHEINNNIFLLLLRQCLTSLIELQLKNV
jgi:hypothetical protein